MSDSDALGWDVTNEQGYALKIGRGKHRIIVLELVGGEMAAEFVDEFCRIGGL
jgi:hypothetical protein